MNIHLFMENPSKAHKSFVEHLKIRYDYEKYNRYNARNLIN
jgi:hypothetical protein